MLRHPHRRRHARHDLPDELARGVPVRAGALGLAGDLRRGRRASSRRSARSRTSARSSSTSIVMEPGDADLGDALSLDAAARARPRPRRVRVGGALPGGHAGGHLPLHLHVRHDRPAEGLPALTRELPRDHGRRGRADAARRGRLVVPLPPARARVRDPDPVRDLRARRDARLLVARPEDDHRGHHPGEPELLPVGAADVREDLHARDLADRGQGGPPQGGRGGREGAHDARGGRGGARAELAAGVRPGRGEALQERARPVRHEHPRVRDRAPRRSRSEILEFFYACRRAR